MRLIVAGCMLASTVALAAQSTTGYLVDSNTDQLFTVDLSTGAATLIASTLNNTLATPADLTWRTTTQELWTIDLSGGAVGTIDVTNGTFTPVYQTALSGWQGLAWDEVTQLFYCANQNGSNYTLDPVTGATTLLGPSGYSLITALDTDISGGLFGIDFSGAMVSIDKVTGVATAMATTIGAFQGLGIDATTGTWYGANTNDDSLHILDTTTGVNTVVGPHGAGVQFAKGFDLIELGANFATVSSFGQGCNFGYASFYESHAQFDLSNTSLQMTNLGNAYLTLPGTNAVVPSTSTPVVMGDDVVLPFALGWTLPYPGGTTTDVYVSSNGFLNLTANTASGCCSFNLNTFLSNGPVFAVKWRDLNPSAGGSVYFDTDPVSGTATVTFDMVPDYGSTTNLNTFQYYFDSAGTVELRFGTVAATAGGTGWSPGLGNMDPGSIDISATSLILTQANDVLPLALASSGRPVIGSTISMDVSRIPAGAPLAAVIYGFTKFDPGVSLANLGMQDCFQYCSQDAVALILSPGTTASSLLTSPNLPALAGVHIIVQGACYDPAGSHNALGALSSNGIDLGLDIN